MYEHKPRPLTRLFKFTRGACFSAGYSRCVGMLSASHFSGQVDMPINPMICMSSQHPAPGTVSLLHASPQLQDNRRPLTITMPEDHQKSCGIQSSRAEARRPNQSKDVTWPDVYAIPPKEKKHDSIRIGRASSGPLVPEPPTLTGCLSLLLSSAPQSR
eukprot:2040319-Amphidinium_carterae.1